VRQFTLTVSIVVAVLLLGAGPAVGHAGLMPGEFAPDVASAGELVLAHGCGPGGTIPGSDEEDLPTTAVTLERPEGLILAPHPTDGWELTTELGDDGAVQRARWTALDPAGVAGTIFLGVEVTADAGHDGQQVWVPVVQDCVDGERLRWTHEGVDEGDGELPAMLVTVDSAVLATSAVTVAEGLSTGAIAALSVALAVLAGCTVAVVTARRG
jgi:uncharacterized protein YcnI